MSSAATLVFSSGARIGALPLEYVQETMRPLHIEPLAQSLPFIDGVAVVRGSPVPVVNVEALLAAGTRSAVNRFITVRAGERSVALGVTSVLGVWPSDRLDIESLPPLLASAAADAVHAIGRLDGRLLVVLSAASLIPPDAWTAVAAHESDR